MSEPMYDTRPTNDRMIDLWTESDDRPMRREAIEFIESVLPALTAPGKNQLCYRRFMNYALSAPFMDKVEKGIVLPFQIGRMMMGHKPNAGVSVEEKLQLDVQKNLLPIEWDPHKYKKGMARVIRVRYSTDPQEHDRIERRFNDLRRQGAPAEADELWWFVKRAPVRPRDLKLQEERIRERKDAYLDAVPIGHPAHELADYLHAQGESRLRRIVGANWSEGSAHYERLLQEPSLSECQRETLTRTWDSLRDTGVWGRYQAVKRTRRLYLAGTNIAMLPSDLRETLLRGTVKVDLASAQLGILASLYGLGDLSDFLAEEHAAKRRGEPNRGIWARLLLDLELPEEFKGTLKSAIYSLSFGMAERKLKSFLSVGQYQVKAKVVKSRGLTMGPEKAQRFHSHPLIAPLIEAREEMAREVGRNGVWFDAWGREVRRTRSVSVISVMAQVAQSYELRLMLPVFRAVQQIVINSAILTLYRETCMTLRIRGSRSSPMYRLPAPSTAKAHGAFNEATVASPPSPEKSPRRASPSGNSL